MESTKLNENSYRDQVIALGLAINPTHWVTLNLHRDASADHAERLLKRWRVELLRRLFGQRFYRLPDEELVHFVGCPERSLAGHPHFHLACRVPAAVDIRFEHVAATRWKAIVPSGTSYIEPITNGQEGTARVLCYTTKRIDPKSSMPFVHSALLSR